MAIIQQEDGVKIPLSKKQLFLLVTCIGPFGVGVFDIYRAYHGSSQPLLLEILGWITILGFGGLPIVFICAVFFFKASGLYINSKGINMVTPFMKMPLSWHEISGFSEKRRQIIVCLKDPDAYLSTKSSITRVFGKLNMSTQGYLYSINTILYQCSPGELMQILETNFEKYKS